MNSQEINALIAEGYKINAVTTHDKNYTKSIIQYRLSNNITNSHYTITKYQALKYLSVDTIENINTHKFIVDIKKAQFNKRVEFNLKIKNIKETFSTDLQDVRLMTMLQVIKNKEFTYL